MTLIDLSASPRSIANRMLAENLVNSGLNVPNNGDSQQAQKAQAEVANNLVQQIKRKREAVAMQQHIQSGFEKVDCSTENGLKNNFLTQKSLLITWFDPKT